MTIVTKSVWVLLLPLALFASGCSETAPEPEIVIEADLTSVRHTVTGDVVGFANPALTGEAHVWRNIPYAAPPVGDLRWRAPRPASNWQGTRVSLEQPEWCVQYTNGLDRGFGYEPGTLLGSEDCLYLNVFAPAFELDTIPGSGEQLPVMLWIHGGSNTWGRAEQYDGSELATRENVIVVVIQYRLGPLGWMAHPALRADAQTKMDASANFGTLDMIAALEWVQDNAASFGGDASRVTIFGESAGGHNVASLLAAAPAAGLFHRAIIQSGSLATVSVAAAEGEEPMPYGWPLIPSQEAINSILQFVRAPNPLELASAMRTIDADVLYEAYHQGSGSISVPRVIADGVVLPIEGFEAAYSNPDTFNAVPVMTGTNRDETRLFNLLDERFVDVYFGIFYRAKNPRLYDAISDYQTRLWRVSAVDTTARAMVTGGHNQVFAYQFDWDEEGSFFVSNFSDLMGAAHGMEIPFVFGEWAFAGDADRFIFTRRNEVARVQLSNAMMSYWGAFAATGDPSGRGNNPDWAPWSDGNIVHLDTETGGGIRAEQGVLSGADVIAAISTDQRLETDEERCLTYQGAIAWFPEFTDPSFMDGNCAPLPASLLVE